MTHDEIVRTIREAGRERKLLYIKAYEEDGTIEPRKVEPYSFRPQGTTERFYFYCLLHNGTRNFYVDKIIRVEKTNESFIPRWKIEL